MDRLIEKALTWLKIKLPIAVVVWFVGVIIALLVADAVLVRVMLLGLGWAGGKIADLLVEKKL